MYVVASMHDTANRDSITLNLHRTYVDGGDSHSLTYYYYSRARAYHGYNISIV